MENTPRISCCTYSPITPRDVIPKPVLGIRDTLVRNRIGRSVHLTNGSGSTDPYLWLTNPDPTPDQTPFFSDFKDAKKTFSLKNSRSGTVPLTNGSGYGRAKNMQNLQIWIQFTIWNPNTALNHLCQFFKKKFWSLFVILDVLEW